MSTFTHEENTCLNCKLHLLYLKTVNKTHNPECHPISLSDGSISNRV